MKLQVVAHFNQVFQPDIALRVVDLEVRICTISPYDWASLMTITIQHRVNPRAVLGMSRFVGSTARGRDVPSARCHLNACRNLWASVGFAASAVCVPETETAPGSCPCKSPGLLPGVRDPAAISAKVDLQTEGSLSATVSEDGCGASIPPIVDGG
ncbi:hypothetical protein VTK26DRAFT_964 [Humicola hyalothermophila]